MNKIISKKIFLKNKIRTPKYFTVSKNEYTKNIVQKLLNKKKFLFPFIIKPNNEGSSLGVKIIDDQKSLKKKVNKLFKYYDQLIFEEYIGGQEIQVAVINNNSLGAIELIPKRSFYDYKAKYTKSAKTKHIMPARLTKSKYFEVLQLAKRAHKALQCKGVTRSDFKFLKINFIY